MADYRTNLTNEVINEVKKFFGDKVYNTVIPRNIRLAEAPGFGKPIVMYDKNSMAAKKYEDFTNELLGIKKETITAENTAKENIDNINQINELEQISGGEIK